MIHPPQYIASIRSAVCAIVLLATSIGASAQTLVLQLRNGDRLTGTVISQTTNEVVLSTSWAKELRIPAAEITQRTELKPASEPAVAAAPRAESLPSGPAPATAVAAEPRRTGSRFADPKSWHGKVDVGIDLGFSENTRELYYGKAKVIYGPQVPAGQQKQLADRFKNTFDFQATYGRTDGTLSANQVNGSSKTDFDITPRVFIYSLIGGGYDEVRRINYQYEVGPGVGYRLITRSNLMWNAEIGMNYQLQNLRRTVGPLTFDDTQDRFSVRLAEESTWTLTRKLVWDQKLEVFPSPDEIGSFRLRFETNLRYSLWQTRAGQNLYLALTILDIFDTQPATGVSNNDLQIRSAVGVSF